VLKKKMKRCDENMYKKIMGVILCILLSCPLFAVTGMAEKKADVQIAGGLGVKVNITNIGNEPLSGFPYLIWQIKYFPKSITLGMSPGMKEPLQPGKSLTWRDIPFARPFCRVLPRQGIPYFCLLTLDAKIYENGGDNTIYGEKIVDALYLCGFVILLSE
jgi:hypothetical protein